MSPKVLVIGCVLVACRIADVDLTGKQCPCPSGWYCNATTATCSRTAEPIDAPPDSTDALPGTVTYREAVIADAPIGYWRLGDTGAIARDEMGHFDGTYTGTGCAFGV